MSSILSGRFAPSPTGPLHLGSLVAAAGSWLSARTGGARWFVRMEDLDRPRVIAGAADEILRTLEVFGLTWDGEVLYQSQRTSVYEAAIEQLTSSGSVFPCSCSRADLARAASAPLPGETVSPQLVYPGTCRSGIGGGSRLSSIRFRVPPSSVTFEDRVRGVVIDDVESSTGDFVVRRADGVFAYQLAVVVDDAAQGITEVVRGADLVDSTARQILLQQALGLPTPSYAHLPLVVRADGAKLGKRGGALPLKRLDPASVADSLQEALRILGFPVQRDAPALMLEEAKSRFAFAGVPLGPVLIATP